MHVAMVYMNGQKMSKSLGNLVFVDALRREWDPRAIRLGVVEHHYRLEWEWDDGLMPRNAGRLSSWLASVGGRRGRVADEVREHMDDDLDTPGAVAALDRAAAAGEDVTEGAGLLGVRLDRPVTVG
ncbi:MAG: cysteine--tRNA ligase, partial [Acidimicrobiales bacterium]